MNEKPKFAIKRSPFYTEPTPVNREPRAFRWSEVEAAHGKPMREILLTLHMEHGTRNAIANELGVSVDTLRNWWRRCSLPEFGANGDGTVSIVICGETR